MREGVRIEARKTTKALDKSYVQEASKKIEDRLFQYLEESGSLKAGETRVFIYNSYGNEVNTVDVIDRLIDTGVLVYLPIVRGRVMQAVRMTHETKMVVGDFGIMEPVGDIYDGEFDISITPLLAYDRELNRMGKGMGYYDRFFAGHIVRNIIGLAFKKQEVDTVCPEPHDIKVNVLINEEETLCE